MALAISGISRVVTSVGIASHLFLAADPFLESRAIWVSVAILPVVPASFTTGLRMANRPGKLVLFSHAEECRERLS